MCVYPLEIFGISHTYLGFCTSFTRKIFSAAPPEEEGPRNQNGPRHQSPNVSSARLKFGDHLDDSWMMAGFCWSDDRWMIFKVSNGSPFLMFFLMIKPLESNQPFSGVSMDQIFDLDFQAHIPHVEPA